MKYLNTTAYDRYTNVRARSVLNYFRVIVEIMKIMARFWAAKGLRNSDGITK